MMPANLVFTVQRAVAIIEAKTGRPVPKWVFDALDRWRESEALSAILVRRLRTKFSSTVKLQGCAIRSELRDLQKQLDGTLYGRKAELVTLDEYGVPR